MGDMASLVGIYLLAAASAASGAGGAPQPVTPVTIEDASELLLSDVQKPPHRLTLTLELARSEAPTCWGLYNVCVDVEGKVTSVKVVRGASRRDNGEVPPGARALDRHWIDTVKGWRFRPHQVNGQATPFCYVAKLEAPRQVWTTESHVARKDPPPVRLTDIDQPPHRPTLPPDLNRAGFIIWGLYKVCVGTEGRVTQITTIKPAHDAALDERWYKAMSTWRYQARLENGQPKPFCFSERLEVRIY